jgi:hypothetical protein
VDVTVSLTVDPDPPVVGESAVLFCSSTGDALAVTRTLEQLDGAPVTLEPLSEGVATFTPGEAGELTFQCTGQTQDGVQSEPSIVMVSAVEPPDDDDDGRRPPRRDPGDDSPAP